MRHRPGQKVQDIAAQVAVRRRTASASSRWTRRASHDPAVARPAAVGHPVRLSVAGIFINRKNVILLLMCIELMLLAVNFNFIAFSRYLGDLSGQVFVFFILTVAAAESAIGLAILVVLFRERRSINVEDLDAMKG